MLTYSYSIEIGVIEMAKEKFNKSTVVIGKILKPIKTRITVEFHQRFSETCIAVDT